MELLTNPVLISVVVMCVLCLLKVNVMLAILVSAVVGGLVAGMPMGETMMTLIGNMGGNSETALSYVLLGTLAVGIYQSGLASMLSTKIEKVFGKSGKVFLIVLTLIACCSQNLVPIHIAFIPILIPPLLKMMNDMKLDRRGAACALAFGLKAPYILLPVGFGAIFQGILYDNMALNGMEVDRTRIWSYMLIPVLGMFVGLLISIFVTYRKPREYQDLPINAGTGDDTKIITDHWTNKHTGAAVGAIATFGTQLVASQVLKWDGGSLPFAAMIGIIIMICFGTISFKKMDDVFNGGVKLMGFIAMVMLVASGYGGVIRATGGVDAIVAASATAVGGSKLLAAIVLLLIGLLVTLGIGTSFGTIPIVATIYVPLCLTLGFSPAATCMLLGVAGALGDAGSPASDTTLGPTAGLNADGQHNHIWDTCVPTFLHYNIPLIIFGTIAAMIL